MQKYFPLNQYNDNTIGDSFRGAKISQSNVDKARDSLKNYITQMDEFQSKILATKRDSNEAYMKMMEDVENLKSDKKSTKCLRPWSKIFNIPVSDLNMDQMKSEIKADNRHNIEKVQRELSELKQNMEKVQTDLQQVQNELKENMEKVQNELKAFSMAQNTFLQSLKELTTSHSTK